MKDAMLPVADVMHWIADDPDSWNQQCLVDGLMDTDVLIEHIEKLAANNRYQWIIQTLWLHRELFAVRNVMMRLVAGSFLRTWTETEPANMCNWLLDALREEVGIDPENEQDATEDAD